MGPVSNPDEFCAALSTYVGAGLGVGAGRVRSEFPEHAPVLLAEIDALLQASRNLPGLWGHEALPLDDACDRIDRFVEVEYPFVPAALRRRFVNAMSYELWK